MSKQDDQLTIQWEPIAKLHQEGIPAYRSKKPIPLKSGGKSYYFALMENGRYRLFYRLKRPNLIAYEIKQLEAYLSKN